MIRNYFTEVQRQLDLTMEQEEISMNQAAEILAKVIENQGLIHVFGSGHCQMFAMEMFYRSGGLVPVNPLLLPHLSITPIAKLSSVFERMEGFAKTYLELENVSNNDAMIIVSVSGRNGSVVDMALAAKALGMTVIALTDTDFNQHVSSRHSSGKFLKDVADVVIDLKVHYGDACMSIEGLEQKFAATSTVLGLTILQSIVARVVEILWQHGIEPPIWTSSNKPEGDRLNADYFELYKNRISSL
ncbi:MAG: SIS domain-containing protein [Erysipelotrichaceae bacterium]|nr:SIS domain-containing protein [Erysipelotrichaceae bacterium]